MNEDVLKAALSYIARGWHVFPLWAMVGDRCSCGTNCERDAGKHPRVRRGMKEASTDEAVIRAWFGPDAPPSNIGVATGAVSGITVLDVDISEGKQGQKTWQELIAEPGEPQTLMAQTGSGGIHVFFKYNSALKTSTNTLGPGVDVRNDGGYVVVAPSNHRSGGHYAWINDFEPCALPAFLAVRKPRGRPRKDDLTRQKYTVEQVRSMLAVVPAEDRDMWRNVGIILGRAFNRADEAWSLYNEWASKWSGKPGHGHNERMREAFYDLSQQSNASEVTMGTIVRAAIEGGWVPKGGEVPIDHFVYYLPGNNFIYRITNAFCVAEAVNAAVSPMNEDGKITKASDWLKQNKMATSMTDDPELDGDFISGVDYVKGARIKAVGAATYNTYRPPTIEPGDGRMAGPFVAHVRRVFPRPGDADQFLNYMAHRVQFPGVKPRFALLIAGEQGVGKDTAVEFCCPAIGYWNVANIEPGDMDSNFNAYAASVLIRISEAANLHEMTKWSFNERLKVLIAGTPDYATINPKYGQQYTVRLHCGIVLTTNHLHTGIYIPADDRRYDVIQTATRHEMGFCGERGDEIAREYFGELWGWFNDGGAPHVAAFLLDRDVSKWSPDNGQRKTDAHAAVVTAGMMSDYWICDVLVELGEPEAVRSDAIAAVLTKDGLNVREYANRLPAALGRAGYYLLRNTAVKDGRWRIDGKLVAVYVKEGVVIKNLQELHEKLEAPRF